MPIRERPNAYLHNDREHRMSVHPLGLGLTYRLSVPTRASR